MNGDVAATCLPWILVQSAHPTPTCMTFMHSYETTLKRPFSDRNLLEAHQHSRQYMTRESKKSMQDGT